MSDVQFTLFFVAVLVGYVLVHLRMVRCEKHLAELAGIRALHEQLVSVEERLQAMAELSEKQGMARVTQQLDQLHEDLSELREAAAQVGEAVVKIPTSAPGDEAFAGGGRYDSDQVPAATRILSRIESRLFEQGYRNLRLIGDLQGVQFADEVEVRVEAERNGMPSKGRVVFHNGSVTDINMQTVAQSFP